MLSAQSLTKRYGADPGYAAVSGASLELAAGELVSVVGRSGSGKSTLLAMLGTLTRPTGGRVTLDGADLWALAEAELAQIRCRQIGLVFQFPSLLPNLTAAGNVALPALLGRTMAVDDAHDRARFLLARVGLGERAASYPAGLSGGEQRRVAIARALVNRPRLLLADEPTSDLDEDTEADIIALLEGLRLSEGFGVVLVTHDLALAGRARRRYEMRQGVLLPVEPAAANAARPPPQRRPDRAETGPPPEAAPAAAREPVRLGADLARAVHVFLVGGAIVLALILLADFGVAKYQERQVRERGARLAQLADLALNDLQGEVRAVTDLGGGRYELAVALRNADPDRPIYVMPPDMRGYVQVGKIWQEIPLTASGEAAGVRPIDGEHIFRYVFEARVNGFTQLLPNYMHVRFSDTMLVSPSAAPRGDVFERRDNYYVYLKPFDIDDATVANGMKFPGKPPLWIPMPPH